MTPERQAILRKARTVLSLIGCVIGLAALIVSAFASSWFLVALSAFIVIGLASTLLLDRRRSRGAP